MLVKILPTWQHGLLPGVDVGHGTGAEFDRLISSPK